MRHNTLIHYRIPGVEKNKVMTKEFDLIVFGSNWFTFVYGIFYVVIANINKEFFAHKQERYFNCKSAGSS